jgi:hypothetical protein
MMQAFTALAIFALLTASALLGRAIRPRLPEEHRNRDTIETMQIIIGMLVTFTALVLGLLTTSVKTAYDKAGHDLQDYALDLTELDRCLRNYGPDAEPARDGVKSYTAAVIASTWTAEPPPTGVSYANISDLPEVGPSRVLGDALNRVYLEIRRLAPADAFHSGLRDDCLADYHTLIRGRITAIEDDRLQISTPFDVILVVWLMIIFAVFGLIAPRNMVSLIGIVSCGVSLSLAMYVIMSLSHPNFVTFSSKDMRGALARMMAP